MKCKHCGNPILGDAKFCTLCGKPVDGREIVDTNTTVDNQTIATANGIGRKLYYDTTTPKRMAGTTGTIGNNFAGSKGVGCLIVFLIFFFTMFFGMFGFVFSMFSMFNNEKVIELGKDEIPTIYGVFDKGGKVCSYSSQSSGLEETIVLGYCDNQLVRVDYEEYIEYLVDDEGFEEVETTGMKKVRKDSKDSSYEIVIAIDYNTGTVVYNKRVYSEYYNDDDYDIDFES